MGITPNRPRPFTPIQRDAIRLEINKFANRKPTMLGGGNSITQPARPTILGG